MTVMRCKMTCHLVAPLEGSSEDNPMARVRFGAVYSATPGEEDAVYGKYTPYAEVVASIASSTADKLKVGKAYYVDFTEVPDVN